MDSLHVALGLTGAGFLGATLWLLRERYRLMSERDLAQARVDDLGRARDAFQSMAGEVMKSSNEEFLKLAKATFESERSETKAAIDKRRHALDELVTPMAKALERTHDQLEKVGKDQASLREQVVGMTRAHQDLRGETSRLVQALRKPNVRGRYGEIQLERVVELAGMKAYCDFNTQENTRDDEGRLQKPDMVVRLPNSRVVAVDAKTSVDSYLDAVDTEDPEEAQRLLARYAENVVTQVQRLSRKAYWTNFDASPEFVIMFIPGDQLVDAALERRPDLIEVAAENNVVLASPSTLIGLLRAIHVGWREKSLSDSAEELFELGRELHERAAVVLGHAGAVGESLERARLSYNKLVGSVESRLMPTLRRFEERGAKSGKELPDAAKLKDEVRELSSAPQRTLYPQKTLPADASDDEPAEKKKPAKKAAEKKAETTG